MNKPFSSLLARLATVDELKQLYSDAQDELEGHLGVPICVANCGICCEHNVPMVWGFEVEAIASYILGQGEKFTKEILDRCEDWLLDNNSGFTVKYLLDHPQKMLEEVHKVNIGTCPLLTSDRKCSVWLQRPVACQAYGVTTYPTGCPRPLGKGEYGNIRAFNQGLGTKINETLNKILQFVSNDDLFASTVGYLPTMLMAKMRAVEFSGLVSSGKVNPVKLATNQVTSPAIITEEQRSKFKLAGDKALDEIISGGIKVTV